jgi:hypothetical protein
LHWKLLETQKMPEVRHFRRYGKILSFSGVAMLMGSARPLQTAKKTQDIPEENQET